MLEALNGASINEEHRTVMSVVIQKVQSAKSGLQGDLPDSQPKGGKAPEGSKSVPGPNTGPEPSVVPESDRRRLHKKGKSATPTTSVHPEAPDNLLEALNGASINEEHRTVMSVVIQKVQSAKSGLTEAYASLLTGFEVRILIYVE